MLSDGRCDFRLFSATEQTPRCVGEGLWYCPALTAGAQRLVWCDRHRHETDVAVPRPGPPKHSHPFDFAWHPGCTKCDSMGARALFPHSLYSWCEGLA